MQNARKVGMLWSKAQILIGIMKWRWNSFPSPFFEKFPGLARFMWYQNSGHLRFDPAHTRTLSRHENCSIERPITTCASEPLPPLDWWVDGNRDRYVTGILHCWRLCPYAYTRRCTAPELRRLGFAQFAMHCELVDRNCLMDSEDSIIFELYHHFLTVSEGLIFQKRTVAISNCSLQNIEHMVSNCQLLRIAGTTL